ncbi:hypothetical protein JRO89_XS02G0122600 [Xanthoceras sorbifolium]|uniref:Uncharacterized protein n=1 Tax=Xanthoceras sorbifolium TaxID=99658 RepID=A0ABQ8IFT8_9ROSI|nr:hypothetical protein JRO89_XS02G0122600 [Xanthoceras sorbifolium]
MGFSSVRENHPDQTPANKERYQRLVEKIIELPFVPSLRTQGARSVSTDHYLKTLRERCDQKHEEEMDSEQIYKNFVLRVMAARSPNVRFRKALCRKDPSANVKCPLTVPAKSSKSRISRLAMVSSISQKMVDGKVKARPLLKHTTTPTNEKAKQSSVLSKSLTTPRNKKGLSNPGTFLSVRNPKPTSVAVPKNRVVAKALVFHSPKKTVKIKTSAELSTRMKAICAGMKKLEITGGKKHESGHNKMLPLDASRKQFKGREVKSRVYDSLRSKNCQGKEAKSSKCLKKKNKEKDIEQSCGPAPTKDTENDSSDMETEEKSRNGSLEVCSTLGSQRNEYDGECLVNLKNSEFPLSKNKGESMSDDTSRNMTSLSNCEEKNSGGYDIPSGQDNKTNEGSDSEEKAKSNSDKSKVLTGDYKENATSSGDKENESKAMSNDEKENDSSADDNSQIEKKKILGKHETYKSIQTVSKGMCKTSKGNSASAVTCAEGVMNYRKPKLTSPKPFRLRTDERQILKEANLEKKLHHNEPLKEITTIARVPGGSSQRKLKKAVHKNETCLEQVEYASDARDGSERESDKTKPKDEPLRMRTSCSQTLKAAIDVDQDRAAKKSEKTFKRTKSLHMKQSRMTRGSESSKKKTISLTTPGRLGVIKECSRPSSSSARRRRTTVPKEPHFHDVHMPKSCTRRVT